MKNLKVNLLWFGFLVDHGKQGTICDVQQKSRINYPIMNIQFPKRSSSNAKEKNTFSELQLLIGLLFKGSCGPSVKVDQDVLPERKTCTGRPAPKTLYWKTFTGMEGLLDQQ